MLSKWMSHICSMIRDFVTGRWLLRIRNSNSTYSFGLSSMRRPPRVTTHVAGSSSSRHAKADMPSAARGEAARGHFCEREGLHHVIVGARIEAGNAFLDRVPCGYHLGLECPIGGGDQAHVHPPVDPPNRSVP